MKPIINWLIIFAFLIGSAGSVFSQNAEQQFQKGLMQEEGEGNLQEAINIYNLIVDNQNAEQSLQAKALLHVGLCYEKMGKKEATKAYQKLVNKFPGEKNEVAIARERLSRLILAEEKLAIKDEQGKIYALTNRKVWDEDDTDLEGAVSPDGKYLSYVDWDTGDLAIFNIATREKRHLTNKGSWDESDEFALISRWSPDSKQIVYEWSDGDSRCDLRIIGIDGLEPQTLYSRKDVNWIHPYDWSPDGNQILTYAEKNDGKDWTTQILLISVYDSAVRILKSSNGSWPENMCFSPDGKYIVYDWPHKEDSPERDIFMLSTDGNHEINLVEHPGHDELFGWPRDVNKIIFGSDRNGTFSLWSKQIKDGNPVANAELIKEDIGAVEPMGITKKGSFFYGNSRKNINMYSVEYNPESGKILTQPEKIITRFEGYNQTPNYSPDGRYLAYVSKRFPLTIFPDYTIGKLGGNVLCIKELETGKEREFYLDLEKFIYPRWSHDGKSVTVMEWDSGSNKVDLQTGNVSSVLFDDNIGPQPTEWSNDGKTMYYVLRDRSTNSYRIIVRDAESGKEKEIYRINGSIHIRLSPDGKWLAIQQYYTENKLVADKIPSLVIMPSTGGEPMVLQKFESGIDIRAGAPFTWTPDGKYILYALKSPKKKIEKWDLYRIAPKGGTPEKLGLEMGGFLTNLSMHPDGHRIAFSITKGSNAEVWMMENFLPLDNSETVEVKKVIEPKFTKIKIPTELSWSVKLSPDGKKLAHVSDKKLWITPLSGNLGPDIPGTPVQLNTDGIEVEWTGLDWSGDGKWIAFNDYPKHNENGEYINNQSIFIVPMEGGTPRKIIENYRDVRVVNYRISLSHDAKKLAFSTIEQNKQQIFSTAVDNIVPRQIVEMEAREPVFSPDGKYIAYVKDKNKGIGSGDLGLYVVKAEGGSPNKLADAGKASSPVWSSDGRMIAYLDYSVGNQINIVPFSITENNSKNIVKIEAPKGTEEVRLLAGWTPDNRIGALITSQQEFGLYTLPSDGGQSAKILHDCYALQPRWSRDGNQIYYVATPEEGDSKSYRRYLASVSANGGKGVPLKANIEGSSVKQFGFQSGNRVSPDGKWIVTSTWIPKKDTNNVNVHWPTSKIWKVSIDGEKAIQITNTPGNISDMSPCWSPDAKKVAFVRFHLVAGNSDLFGDSSQIYTINSNGGVPELLTSVSGKYVNSLVWSPDGKTIAYLTKEKNQPNTKSLNLYDFKTKETRILGDIESVHVNIEMAWSPDCKRIAFNDKEGKVIKVMNIEDGKVEEVTTGLVDVNIYHLDWSPDGKRFVFGGWKGGGAEFWMLEDFLPSEKIYSLKE